MNTKTVSNRALSVIDQYIHFKFGNAVCSVPYFNNKTARMRAALRARVGKGSPKDIFEEIQAVATKNHITADSLADQSLKMLLVDENIGIDCSGFAYYVLNAENGDRGKGVIDKHLHFVNCKGIVGKIRCSMRPAENCDIATLANNRNSGTISIKEIRPGDIITMIGKSVTARGDDRDHVLIIHQADYQNFTPTKLYYTHAVAYPEDGLYGTGVRQGAIEITDTEKSLVEQKWLGDNLRIFERARNSKTEIRRLNWF
ncbi:hypothetical protein KGQ27_02760 [Patescibacteria group bacterium]|nr:hypothetical protein [Patescibacteria group bacterium]MDE1946789.1 hypothetical protein [Patescibacteria group bacterium]MDE2011079.1 hypothetical protein [Patescibacteria group bacterium]MDE2233136.1 hypothetical protein [Patescibacteria group bacterium]